MAKDSFWLVWSPLGYRPPSFRHTTKSAAEAEARRLAELNPGKAFFTLKAESVSVKETVVTRHFPTDDEIPCRDVATKDAVIAELVGALNAVVNDDGLQDLIAGIGEVPPFWSMAKAALALAADATKEGR